MGVCLYLYLHTNTDEEVYRRLWTRQFTVVLSWGNGATRGLPDSTYMSHHLIFFSQMCYFTDDLFSVSSWKDITMRVSMEIITFP